MPDAIYCGECGAIQPAYWPKALCARCALDGLSVALTATAVEPATLTLTGDWQIKVNAQNAERQPSTATLNVTPPAVLSVKAGKIAALPVFNPKAGGWVKGVALGTVRAQECTTSHLLKPESLDLRTGPKPDALLLTRETDYEADFAWATIGRPTSGVLKKVQSVRSSACRLAPAVRPCKTACMIPSTSSPSSNAGAS